jgi:hypothetical protein
MDMIGHEDESVQCVATFATVVIKGFEEQSGICFDDKQLAAVPG